MWINCVQFVYNLEMANIGNISGDIVRAPADSGTGQLFRPARVNQSGTRAGPPLSGAETFYDFFIDVMGDPSYAFAVDPNADMKVKLHPTVAAAFRLRSLSAASMPASIHPSRSKKAKQDLAAEVAEYVQEVFDGIPNIIDMYRLMLSAVLEGSQGLEFIWKLMDDGSERPIGYLPIHKSRLIYNREGAPCLLTRLNPVWGQYVSGPDAIFTNGESAWLTPGGKFVIARYMRTGGTWQRPIEQGFWMYGYGEIEPLYNLVMFDNFITKFQLKFLERFGFPMTVVGYSDADQGAKAKLREIAQAIRSESVVSIPHPSGQAKDYLYSIDYQQPQMTGNDAFASFRQSYLTPAIEKILLGGEGMLGSGNKGGFSAQVDQRENSSDVLVRYDAKAVISDTLDTQLIPFIVRANPKYAALSDEYMPKHVMVPEKSNDREAALRVIGATAALVPVSKQDVYKAAGVDRPKEGTDESELIYLGSGDSEMIGAEDGMPSAFMKKSPKGVGGEPYKPTGKGEKSEKSRELLGKNDK